MAESTFKNELLKLLRKYLQGKSSKSESAFVDKYYDYFEKEADYVSKLTNEEQNKLGKELLEGSWKKASSARTLTPLRSYYWMRMAASVAVILSIGSGLFYISRNIFTKETVTENIINPGNQILPGGNKAILTLADNSTVILDSAQNGLITNQGNTQIVKLADGQLSYDAGKEKDSQIKYNTISTPVGGQYQLTLSDGTKVWLNAASSIRFPVAFSGKARNVFITGEVYFEVNPVSSNASTIKGNKGNVPFLVDVAGKGIVKVLGTHFNINSYSDEEAVETTLLEGRVSLTPAIAGRGKEPSPVMIIPGQQVLLHSDGMIQYNNNVNLEKVVAWKNGYFYFSSSSLQEVMSQMARWYSVEVVFEGKIISERFSGKIQRDLNLSEALKILEVNNIKFRIEGKKIFVGS